jgi:hypothetical protein
MAETHEIYSTTLEDGSTISVSIDSPRFCVGAPTKEEALRKAERALIYFHSVEQKPQARATPRILSPSYEREAVCA